MTFLGAFAVQRPPDGVERQDGRFYIAVSGTSRNRYVSRFLPFTWINGVLHGKTGPSFGSSAGLLCPRAAQ